MFVFVHNLIYTIFRGSQYFLYSFSINKNNMNSNVVTYADDDGNYVFNGKAEAFAEISDTAPTITRKGMGWFDTVSQSLFISDEDGVGGFIWVQT